jgi:hypothetical protein
MVYLYMQVWNVSAVQLKDLHQPKKRQDADHVFNMFEEFLKKLKLHFKTIKKQIKQLIDT